MTKAEIKSIIISIIAQQLSIETKDICDDQVNIYNNLGCDGIDAVDIWSFIEDEFSVKIDKKEFFNLTTIDDMVGFVYKTIQNSEQPEDTQYTNSQIVDALRTLSRNIRGNEQMRKTLNLAADRLSQIDSIVQHNKQSNNLSDSRPFPEKAIQAADSVGWECDRWISEKDKESTECFLHVYADYNGEKITDTSCHSVLWKIGLEAFDIDCHDDIIICHPINFPNKHFTQYRNSSRDMKAESKIRHKFATEAQEIEHTLFKFGDNVIKKTGDYQFIGEIRGIVTKKSGAIRYVVEDDRGILFIFNGDQLEWNPNE